MNNKHREILRIHRNFLVKNIIWTEALESRLLSQGLLVDSQLREIQKLSTRDEKVGKFLDALPIQGGTQAYEKFGDILQFTGHFFLADFIRNEDNLSEKVVLTDALKKFPFINNRLQASEKKELENFLADKFRSESLRQLWRNDIKEKEKALEAKSRLLEQAYDFEGERKRKQEEIKAWERKLEESQKETEAVRSEIPILNSKLRELEEKYKKSTSSQLRFNDANESVIQRTSEKLEKSEQLLMDMHVRIVRNLHEKTKNRPTNAREEIALQIDQFKYIMKDLDDLLKQYQNLLVVKQKHEELMFERDYVVSHMGHDPSGADAPSLKDAYRDFVVKNDEKYTEMKNKLAEYGDLLEEHKTSLDAKKKFQAGAGVWQSAIMNVMRNQLNDLKQQQRLKDTRMQMYETEAAKLKTKVTELERELRNTSKNQKPPSVNTVEKVTLQHLNGVDSSFSMRSCPSDEFDGVSDYHRADNEKKEQLLPPIAAPRGPSPVISPRKAGPKPTVITPKRQMYAAMPNGLITTQVRMEARQKHALGDLKALHLHSKSKFEKTLAPAKVNF